MTGIARRSIGALKSSGRFRSIQRVPSTGVGIRTPARNDALTAEEHGKSGVLPTPWLPRRSNHKISIPEPESLPTESRACVPARFCHKQPQQKIREISRCDEPVRGAGRRGLRQLGDKRGVVVVVAEGGSVVWRVNCGSWEKAPRLSRETGGHETPARSPTFRLTAGLTAGSDAPEQSLPPPVRATPPVESAPAAHISPSTLQLPAGLPVHSFPTLSPIPQLRRSPLAIPSRRTCLLPLPTTPRRNTALVVVHPPLYALVTLPFFATR